MTEEITQGGKLAFDYEAVSYRMFMDRINSAQIEVSIFPGKIKENITRQGITPINLDKAGAEDMDVRYLGMTGGKARVSVRLHLGVEEIPVVEEPIVEEINETAQEEPIEESMPIITGNVAEEQQPSTIDSTTLSWLSMVLFLTGLFMGTFFVQRRIEEKRIIEAYIQKQKRKRKKH